MWLFTVTLHFTVLFYSIILKRVAEEIFNIAQLFTHYLSQFQLNLHLLLLHT